MAFYCTFFLQVCSKLFGGYNFVHRLFQNYESNICNEYLLKWKMNYIWTTWVVINYVY